MAEKATLEPLQEFIKGQIKLLPDYFFDRLTPEQAARCGPR
jgi:hypothetical protein